MSSQTQTNLPVHWNEDHGDTEQAMVTHGSKSNPDLRNHKKVQSVNLEKFLPDTEQIELLKIDCEGCEYEIIPAMPNMLCKDKRIRRIEAEMHGDPKLHPLKKGFISKQRIQRTQNALKACGCSKFNRWLHCIPKST